MCSVTVSQHSRLGWGSPGLLLCPSIPEKPGHRAVTQADMLDVRWTDLEALRSGHTDTWSENLGGAEKRA